MTQQDQGSGTNADGDRPGGEDTGFGGEPTTGQASDGGWDRHATDEDAVEGDRLGEGEVPWSGAADAATPEGADSWAASADAEPAPGSEPGRG